MILSPYCSIASILLVQIVVLLLQPPESNSWLVLFYLVTTKVENRVIPMQERSSDQCKPDRTTWINGRHALLAPPGEFVTLNAKDTSSSGVASPSVRVTAHDAFKCWHPIRSSPFTGFVKFQPRLKYMASTISSGKEICDGFSHVVSNKSTMQVNRKTSCFCMQDKEPLLLRGHTRACT
jgi:hypothetical protein